MTCGSLGSLVGIVGISKYDIDEVFEWNILLLMWQILQNYKTSALCKVLCYTCMHSE